MLHVYIIVSNDDRYVERVVTLLAESDEQALQMASKETLRPIKSLDIQEKCTFLDHPQIIDSTTNYYGV